MIDRRTFLTSLLMTPALAAGPELRWLPPSSSDFEIDGLPWFGQNGGEFFRLPAASQEKFPPPVWNLAKSPSGARVRFRTDATTLAIRLEYPSPPNMNNMHAFGQTGVDLYADGVYRGTAIADKDTNDRSFLRIGGHRVKILWHAGLEFRRRRGLCELLERKEILCEEALPQAWNSPASQSCHGSKPGGVPPNLDRLNPDRVRRLSRGRARRRAVPKSLPSQTTPL
jgi:hypothetical protein